MRGSRKFPQGEEQVLTTFLVHLVTNVFFSQSVLRTSIENQLDPSVQLLLKTHSLTHAHTHSGTHALTHPLTTHTHLHAHMDPLTLTRSIYRSITRTLTYKSSQFLQNPKVMAKFRPRGRLPPISGFNHFNLSPFA